MLGGLEGVSVLDLFAGTGALGIEALSRGAERAVFVERDATALRVLRENLAALELSAPRAQVRPGDALAAIRNALGERETYDLLLIDPPYGHVRRWQAELAAAIPPLLAPGARVVVESDRRAPLRLLAPVDRERRYGDTTITIHSSP